MTSMYTKSAARELADKLDNDKIFNDLLGFAQETIGRATHDSLLRFKWGNYKYHEGVVALTFVLATILAVVNRDVGLSEDDLAEMIRLRVKSVRAQKDKEDEDDEED